MRYFSINDPSLHQSDQPEIVAIQIPGRYGKLFSTYYIAKGSELHPTIVLCHGFPGNDQLQDMTQYLRFMGYNIITFHYSGSWGSGGPYAFRHCVRDTEAVIDFIKKNHEILKADPDRLGIIGFDVGAFVAGHVYSLRKELKVAVLISTVDLGEVAAHAREDAHLREDLLKKMKDGAAWLKGTTGDILYNEIAENADSYKLTSCAQQIVGRPLLIIEATQDTIAPPKYNIYPLLDMLQSLQRYLPIDEKNAPVHITMEADHHYAEKRRELFLETYKHLKKYI